MSSPEPYYLNLTHEAVFSENIVKIYNRESKDMEYVGIVGSKQCFVKAHIFPGLRTLSYDNPGYLPEMLLPSKLDGYKDFIIPVKCIKNESLSELKSDWFFERVGWVYDKNTELNVSRPLYLMLQFKVFLYILIKNIIISLKSDVRPIIDPSYIFISHVGGVIFTKYQMRRNANWEHEREELAKLLEWILVSHNKNSETIDFEMKELILFLRTNNSKTVSEKVLEEIVFWSPQMRIKYIYQLTERVISYDRISKYHRYNEEAVYSKSSGAFLVDGSNEWYQTIQDSNDHVLIFIYKKGNKHVDLAWKQTNKYRTYDFDGKSDSFILVCGLVRLRDAHLHLGDHDYEELFPSDTLRFYENVNGKVVFIDGKVVFIDVNLQAKYQVLFPQHMVEFKKLLDCVPEFDAITRVTNLLGAFQDEASTS